MKDKTICNVLTNISNGGTGIEQCPPHSFSKQLYIDALQAIGIISIGSKTTLTDLGREVLNTLNTRNRISVAIDYWKQFDGEKQKGIVYGLELVLGFMDRPIGTEQKD